MHNVLIRPLVTEKMTSISEAGNKFGFIVDINANKIEIAKAIEKKFDVNIAGAGNGRQPSL